MHIYIYLYIYLSINIPIMITSLCVYIYMSNAIYTNNNHFTLAFVTQSIRRTKTSSFWERVAMFLHR